MIDPLLPLVIDVDGTLIRNDLTFELFMLGLTDSPLKLPQTISLGLVSKSKMKDNLIERVGDNIAVEHLTYNAKVIETAKRHKEQGGDVVLCSGSHQTLIDKIVAHFDWISTGFGTTVDVNLTKENKAEFLKNTYPEGFHYIGNSTQDYPVWKAAQTALAVSPPSGYEKITSASGEAVQLLDNHQLSLKNYLKCIRIHQWAKNGLVGLVPLLTFMEISIASILNVVIGFFALSFLASATYILNDLLDIQDDRLHPTKKFRPIANGTISIPRATLIMTALAFLSLFLCLFLPGLFFVVFLAYLALTLSYSFKLKRIVVLDVIILAGLFTIRVIAGATLVEQPISPWLLNFVATFFLSLALVKRYTEIRKKVSGQVLHGRGYEKEDESLILSLGIMTTGLAILSFLLYSILAENPVIHSQVSRFAILTVLTYWLMRIWFFSHRRILNDDPVLFAVKDRLSLVFGVLLGGLVLIEQLVFL